MIEFLSRWETVLMWLAVAIAARHLLGWSFKEIFAAAMREVRETAQLRPTVAGLNGMGVSLTFLLICGVMFFPSLTRLASLAGQAPSINLDPNIALAALVLVFLFSLMCVLRDTSGRD